MASDGTSLLAERSAAVRCVAPVPCSTGGEIKLADEHLSPGRHEVSATFTDAGGNQTVIGPHTIGSVESPHVVVRDAAVAPAAPRGVVALSGRRTIRARYSAPPVIRGTVRALDGAAIGGARLAVSGPTGAW